MHTAAQALALGLQHQQAGELPRAEQIYRQVLAAEPNNTQALDLLGMLALRVRRFDDAVALLRQTVALEPANSSYQGHLGLALAMAERWPEARPVLEEAVRRDPFNFDAQYNLGLTLSNLRLIDEAVAQYRHCLRMRPTATATHNNLGILLRIQGKRDEALLHFDRAIAWQDNFLAARYNRSVVLLTQGRLAEAWPDYHCRTLVPEFGDRLFAQPLWDGTPLGDKTLLVHPEQGLGDTLQFIRYLPLVKQRCPNLIAEVQPPLLPLVEQAGMGRVFALDSPLPAFDVQITYLSLPGIFQTTLDTIPAQVPYLRAADALIAEWRDKLAGTNGLKVGIAWHGKPSHGEDCYRSIALSQFRILSQVPGVQLYSLQMGPAREHLKSWTGPPIIDLADRPGDFHHTAAIMHNLDLVITCDSSPAHLAGALGVPVWIAVAIGPDWRWLAEGEESRWYPTARLFRQTEFGNWQPVFERMAARLQSMVGGVS
jgi:Flp pilus assembly protein TadD